MSLRTILLFEAGGGGLVVLVAACMYWQTFRSLCVRCARVGMITRLHSLVFLVCVVIVMLYLAALKPDRVVRSRGRSGMGSNIAWHRRHNDSVD